MNSASGEFLTGNNPISIQNQSSICNEFSKMTFDMASPAGGYYVCKTYFIVGGRKIRHLGGTNQFKPSRRPRLTELKKYLKERHPQGGENLAIFSTGGYFLGKYSLLGPPGIDYPPSRCALHLWKFHIPNYVNFCI